MTRGQNETLEHVRGDLQAFRLHRDEKIFMDLAFQILDARVAAYEKMLEAAEREDFSLQEYMVFLQEWVRTYARFEEVAKTTALETGEFESFMGVPIFDTPIIVVYRLIKGTFQYELTRLRNRFNNSLK
jgi:hypothetical protein